MGNWILGIFSLRGNGLGRYEKKKNKLHVAASPGNRWDRQKGVEKKVIDVAIILNILFPPLSMWFSSSTFPSFLFKGPQSMRGASRGRAAVLVARTGEKTPKPLLLLLLLTWNTFDILKGPWFKTTLQSPPSVVMATRRQSTKKKKKENGLKKNQLLRF